MFNIGMSELVIVFLIVFLLFGGSRLPEIARSMGKSLKEFKRAVEGIKSGIEDATKEDNIG